MCSPSAHVKVVVVVSVDMVMVTKDASTSGSAIERSETCRRGPTQRGHVARVT